MVIRTIIPRHLELLLGNVLIIALIISSHSLSLMRRNPYQHTKTWLPFRCGTYSAVGYCRMSHILRNISGNLMTCAYSALFRRVQKSLRETLWTADQWTRCSYSYLLTTSLDSSGLDTATFISGLGKGCTSYGWTSSLFQIPFGYQEVDVWNEAQMPAVGMQGDNCSYLIHLFSARVITCHRALFCAESHHHLPPVSILF